MKVFLPALFLLAGMSSLAQAADEPAAPASPFTANISLTTKYKYRGLDQARTTALSPALQGGFDYSQNGFYVGNWNSSIKLADGSQLEMDLYGGYKGTIAEGLGYDVGLLQYLYHGASVFNTTEFYAGMTYGPASFKYSLTASKDYFGYGDLAGKKGRGTSYFDFSVNQEVVKGLTLNGHLGFTMLARGLRSDEVGLKNYLDYKLGATYDVGSGLSFSGAVVGATQKKYYGDGAKPRVILAVTKTM